MKPKIEQKKTYLRDCTKCGSTLSSDYFIKTKSILYPDGLVPMCNDCIKEFLVLHEFNWEIVDKLCQYIDVPFVPAEFERLHDWNGDNVFPIYAQTFLSEEYENLGWGIYFRRFQELKEQNAIESELPEIHEENLKHLQERWGANYDEEALTYLENLYQGLCATQNVSSALQIDQALKVCKLSYEIDCRIRAGSEFDKILASYDKIVKTADFTPKSVKNASDFDSFGEVARWLEKRGWRAKYFDGVTKDIVDETINNIQVWNQRLYTEESGIGDEITRRIEALKSAKQLEEGTFYSEEMTSGDALDRYENDGFDKLFANDNFDEDVD